MLENFDFTLLDNEDFKEDSVRELIIKPLLDKLGFEGENAQESLSVRRSVALKSDTVIGSNKRIKASDIVIPDYLLYVDSKVHCVLDAKAPEKSISPQSDNERQAFYYAINKDIKSPLYALCNGKMLIIYETAKQEILLEIDLEKELNSKFSDLSHILTTPLESLREILDKAESKKPDSWYLDRQLPQAILKPKKRAKFRYFGCTAYFTRQSWDIVAQNIKNFTNEGDVVLDSFGGSGVSAIEAMMSNRLGIHTDLNPLSIFMVKALSVKVNLSELYDLSEEVIAEFESLKPKDEKEAKKLLKNAKYYPNAMSEEFGEIATQKSQDEILWIPKNEILPKGSDVDCVLNLFSPLQLVELAILRKLIFKHTTPSGNKEHRIEQRNMRYSLLLAFYNTITMCNLTYHTSSYNKGNDKGGMCAALNYYRYRIAKQSVFVEVGETFRGKIQRVIKGKKELENSPYFYHSYFAPLNRVIKDFKGSMINQRENLDKVDSMLDKTNGEKIFQADATNLKEIENESIDFIYTDPPYGAKIPYLDLSTMWNTFLDLPVELEIRQKECIEKGSLEKSKYDYYDLMKASLKEMYRVLKFNRWLAFVFQHQEPKLFQILVESAENVGFEYVACVSQENTGIDSFRKVQNPTRVLKGQLIIYFKKVDNAKARTKLKAGEQSLEQMYKDVEKIIVDNNGASLEAIHAHLVKNAIEGGYYELMAKFENVLLLINERFDYDKNSKLYHIRSEASILNYAIPIEERARYYILGELTKAKKENRSVAFDKFLSILPLLKNGVQANNKLIKEILNELAIEDKETGEWRLKSKEATLFD